jgi:hypothetical protein
VRVAVCDSARNSVWLCARQCVAVRAAVCRRPAVLAAVCGCPAVRQYAEVMRHLVARYSVGGIMPSNASCVGQNAVVIKCQQGSSMCKTIQFEWVKHVKNDYYIIIYEL